MPFSEVSLSFPILGVTQSKAGFITGSWIGLMAHLTVSYKADGKGPEVIPDSNMMPVSVHSLWTAVAAASKAVGYDPRYLSVRLLIPTPMEGPSAGGIFAVGIAAALLGALILGEPMTTRLLLGLIGVVAGIESANWPVRATEAKPV